MCSADTSVLRADKGIHEVKYIKRRPNLAIRKSKEKINFKFPSTILVIFGRGSSSVL